MIHRRTLDSQSLCVTRKERVKSLYILRIRGKGFALLACEYPVVQVIAQTCLLYTS